MSKGNIMGAVVMAVCCFGCAVLFGCIGINAAKSNRPVNFWAGTNVPAEKVRDLYGYNHACSLMWKIYAVPYWIAGIFGCLGVIGDAFIIVSAVLLFIAGVPGVAWLIYRYKRMEKQYICNNALTNRD